MRGDDDDRHVRRARVERLEDLHAADLRHHHRVARVALRPILLGQRIDEHHRLASAQHELIDRVQRLRWQILGMDHEQGVDLGRDRRRRAFELPHVEQLLQLADARPWRRRRRIGAGRRPAVDGEIADEADHALLRVRERVDELADLVLERVLAVRVQEGDGHLVVHRIGADQAEIARVARRVQGQLLDAVADRLILRFGERLGLDHLQLELAAGLGGVFLQQVAHALAVVEVLRQGLELLGGEVEAQGDRLIELRQHIARAGRQRVEPVLSDVEPARGQRLVADDVDAEEQHQRDGDADEGLRFGLHEAPLPLSCSSSLRSRACWRRARTRSAWRSR